jgi:hypothetical protein
VVALPHRALGWCEDSVDDYLGTERGAEAVGGWTGGPEGLKGGAYERHCGRGVMRKTECIVKAGKDCE